MFGDVCKPELANKINVIRAALSPLSSPSLLCSSTRHKTAQNGFLCHFPIPDRESRLASTCLPFPLLLSHSISLCLAATVGGAGLLSGWFG